MEIKLVKKIQEIGEVTSFFWEPLKKIDFLPGQYLHYTLSDLLFEDPRGQTRDFSISSSPTEGNLLRLTTRIREKSGFKKTLNALNTGDIISAEGPQGTFVIDEKENSKNHVFLAGGIGVTPYRSFIKFNIDNNLKTPMYLIYSHSDSNFIFGEELTNWSAENTFVKLKFMDTSKTGHLDNLKIKKLIGNWKLEIGNCIYWCSGSSSFVSAMEEVLDKLGVPTDDIRTDKFTGY